MSIKFVLIQRERLIRFAEHILFRYPTKMCSDDRKIESPKDYIVNV